MAGFFDWLNPDPVASPPQVAAPKAGTPAISILEFISSAQGAAAATELIKIASLIDPPLAGLAALIPIIQRLSKTALGALETGLADGSLMIDSGGGIIPAHGQSIYDPKTGRFTGEKT